MATRAASLTATRQQLHCVVRLVGAFGYKAIPHVARYYERSLTWQPDPGILFTQVIPAPEPFRAGVDLSTAELVTIQGATLELARLPIVGATIASSEAWLREQALSQGLDPALLSPMDREELEPHPALTGAPFELDGDALSTLAEVITVSADAFGKLRAARPRASIARFWPHHLDMSLSITKGDPTDLRAPTVTVGCCLGDRSYADPYWYITIAPVPKGLTILTLQDGRHWHTEGWTGVVLPFATYRALGTDLDARKAGIEAFVMGTAGNLWDRIQ